MGGEVDPAGGGPAGGAPFAERFSIRWSDLDANRHVRNTAFGEFGNHTRLRFLEAHGFSMARFEAARVGPILFREELLYRRELLLGDEVVVTVRFSGLSEDGSRWRALHEMTRSDGVLSAEVTVEGAWIHLDRRRLVAPPDDLLEGLRQAPRTPDFEVLRSVLRPLDGG